MKAAIESARADIIAGKVKVHDYFSDELPLLSVVDCNQLMTSSSQMANGGTGSPLALNYRYQQEFR